MTDLANEWQLAEWEEMGLCPGGDVTRKGLHDGVKSGVNTTDSSNYWLVEPCSLSRIKDAI